MDQNPPILADKQFLEVTSQKKLYITQKIKISYLNTPTYEISNFIIGEEFEDENMNIDDLKLIE